MTGGALIARALRSGLEESRHLGHVAVCDAAGSVVARAGDSGRPVFARSAMKPVQAAVSLQAMGARIPEAELAVMCASHNGEAVHAAAVSDLLARGDLSEDDLRCPPARPLDPEAAAEAGEERRILHNCSGKHAGMLLACRSREWEIDTYLDPRHPLQEAIHRAVLAWTGLTEATVGVDGCGAPVPALPLASLARLYAWLGDGSSGGELGDIGRRCTLAMAAHPYLVAGRERLETALMETVTGIFVKGGAEGLLCAGLPERGLGVAVKVADGSSRAAGPALLSVLRQLDALDDDELYVLRAHARPPVLGGGRVVGELQAAVRLRP